MNPVNIRTRLVAWSLLFCAAFVPAFLSSTMSHAAARAAFSHASR